MPNHTRSRELRILLSEETLSRRRFVVGGLAFAASLAGGAKASAALDRLDAGSITSLTYSGQRWGLVQSALIPGFTKQSGVSVKLVTYPISQGYARILTPLGAGSSAYDLIDIDYGILAESAPKLTPLDDYLAKDPAFKHEYETSVSANVRGLYKFNGSRLGSGTTYGIANDGNTQLGYYRTDIFKAAGIKSPPKTWPEALAVAKELTVNTKNGKQYGFTTNGQRGVYSSTLFGQVLFSVGGNWLDPHNQPTIDTEKGREALNTIVELMKYADPSVPNSADNETINAMASGVAVYSPNAWGNNAFTNPKLNKLGNVIRAALCVAGPGPTGKHAALMGGFGLVIPNASKNKDQAFEFIKYLTAKANQKAAVEASAQPARTDALKEFGNIASFFPVLADSLKQGIYQPGWLRNQSGFYEALGTQVSLAMLKQRSVTQALKDAQSSTTKALKSSGDIK